MSHSTPHVALAGRDVSPPPPPPLIISYASERVVGAAAALEQLRRARRRPRSRLRNRSSAKDFGRPAAGPFSIGNPTIMVSGKKSTACGVLQHTGPKSLPVSISVYFCYIRGHTPRSPLTTSPAPPQNSRIIYYDRERVAGAAAVLEQLRRARRRPRSRLRNRSSAKDFGRPAGGPVSIGNPTITGSRKKKQYLWSSTANRTKIFG